jgi:hypothetical protein
MKLHWLYCHATYWLPDTLQPQQIFQVKTHWNSAHKTTVTKIIRILIAIGNTSEVQNIPLKLYKVVQIWPGLLVCKQVTVCPGHIWTTLYLDIQCHFPIIWRLWQWLIQCTGFVGQCSVLCLCVCVCVCTETHFINACATFWELIQLPYPHYYTECEGSRNTIISAPIHKIHSRMSITVPQGNILYKYLNKSKSENKF